MWKLLVLFLIVSVSAASIFFYMNNKTAQKPPLESLVDSFFSKPENPMKKVTHNNIINYAAIGDSYTSGYGLEPALSYPYLLAKHLNDAGINTELANFAVSGYTTQNAVDYQLPQLESSDANFVTVLIGGNDIAQRRNVEVYRQQYKVLLNRVQAKIPAKSNVLLISLPDFSRTPYVEQLGYTEEEVREEILKYNRVVNEEAKNRNLPVVDLFQDTGSLITPDMILDDGLHPTAKQYAVWEKEIFPVAYNMLN